MLEKYIAKVICHNKDKGIGVNDNDYTVCNLSIY